MSRSIPSFRRHVALALALAALAIHVPDDASTPTPPGATTSTTFASASMGTSVPRTPPTPVGDPLAVHIAAIDVDVPLGAVGLKPDGAMQTPGTGEAAWYSLGPRPGEPCGAVLVAHVAGRNGPDVFWRLGELRPGDVVTVDHTAGTSTFVVDRVTQTAKEALPVDDIWVDTRQPLLRLITCGGTVDPTTGRYRDNTVVYAHLT